MVAPLSSIKQHFSDARHIWRGFHNIVDIWPRELFEKEFIHYRVFFRDVFVVNDPADVERVMVTNVENYPKSDVAQRMLKPLIGDSMFITHGEHWKRQRRFATPAFHSRHIRSFAAKMAEQTLTMLSRWNSLQEGDVVEVSREMTHLTADIICSTLFSDDIGKDADEVFEAFAEYQASLGRLAVAELMGLPRGLPRWGQSRGRRAAQRLDAIVSKIVRRRRDQHVEKQDLLSLLLDATDPESGEQISDRLVRDELLFLFLAGHETTANAMIWTWYLLSQNPGAEKRLHDEVDQVLGDRTPSYDDVSKMEYLRAVLMEAMRLYPPVHVFAREAAGNDVIHGHDVPAGSLIVVSPWIIQRHRKLWQNPDSFDPDRFLGKRIRDHSRYSYLPFSAGPRTCLGTGFAMTEMSIAASMISRRYRLRIKDDHPVEPIGRLTLRPRFGLPMSLHHRAGHQSNSQ